MKKTIFSLALLAVASVAAVAQDFKPTSGMKTLELQAASPFAAGRPFSIDNIRLRYFIADDLAVRIQFGIFVDNERNVETVNDPTSTSNPQAQIELVDRERLLNINIKPGIEKHFEGTDRLSPYLGAEIDFAIQSASSVDEAIGNGSSANTISTVTERGRDTRGNDGFTRIGLNLVAGADYYITKNIYLGAEIGWGLQNTSLATIKVEREGFDPAPPAAPDVNRGGNLQVGTNFIGAFRFGWAF